MRLVEVLLSVVTVCRNAEVTLGRTLESVRRRKHEVDFEYVIVDGASQDRTVQILQENRDIIDELITEPDQGVYDAMNKGARRAKGDFVLFLNADDRLAEGFSGAHSALSDKSIYFASVLFWSRTGAPDHLINPRIDEKGLQRQFTSTMFAPHQGMFVRREILLRHPFRSELRVCGDFDFLLTVVEAGYDFERLNHIVVDFFDGGVSSGPHRSEYLSVLLNHIDFYRERLTPWERKLVYREVLRSGTDRLDSNQNAFLSALNLSLLVRLREQGLLAVDRLLKRA